MEITQKKSGHKLVFTFKKHVLNYAYKNSNGSGDYDIKYADIPFKSIIYIEQNDWLRNVGWFWIIFGSGANIYRVYSINMFDKLGIIFIISGILCLVWTYIRKIKFIIYETPKANILIEPSE